MSDDLIRRSALLEELESFSMRITGSANAMALAIVDECKKSFKIMVDEQPTAYDMDKVVEQICGCDGCSGCCNCHEEEKMLECEEYARVYDIVKAGGIDDRE